MHGDLVAAFDQMVDIDAQVAEAGQGRGDRFDLGFRSDPIGDPGMRRDKAEKLSLLHLLGNLGTHLKATSRG